MNRHSLYTIRDLTGSQKDGRAIAYSYLLFVHIAIGDAQAYIV